MEKLSRRELFGAAAGLGAALLAGCDKKHAEGAGVQAPASRAPRFDAGKLAVASGSDAARNVRAAVDALGGIRKLVRKGDFVVIKPNMAWNRPPELAATTNPKVVAELVRMCREAGAGRVLVVDHIIDRPAEAVLGLTGIGEAARNAGAEVGTAPNESDYRSIEIPGGRVLKSDTCIKDVLKADVFINVPIAKVHGSSKLTLGMKNLMGCNWDRQSWHQSDLAQCIADYSTAIRPDLIVLDANRILTSNGPKGPGQTRDVKKVVAGVDPVAVDAYGAGLFGMKPEEVPYIRLAAEMGVGEMNLARVKVISS